MNIDSRVITVALFLLVQAVGAVIFGAKLSSEVVRIGNVQAASMEDTSGLDVLAFKVDELRKEIANLRQVDEAIMIQHEKIFEWMASSDPSQQKGGYGGYGN